MPVTLYEASVVPFINTLKNLLTVIEKARAHVGNDEKVITEARLIEDMQDFCFQIQRLSDISKGLATRVAGAPPVSMPDKEKTFPELRERIEKTLIILEGLSPNSMELMEDQEIILPTPWGDKTFASGKTYVLEYVIPSFYFHYCMAYALMRKEGVQIGKLDYLGLSLE